MSSTTNTPATTPAPTTNTPAQQNAEAATSIVQAADPVTVKAIENMGHHSLHGALVWLRKEFAAAGLKIEEEIKKI